MIFSPISKRDGDRIVEAIKRAEKNTSGEIRVHIQRRLFCDIMDSAKKKFLQLGLDNTALKNGVLFYISFNDRKLAVLGDSGIDAVVPPDFWQATIDLMLEYFKKGDVPGGIEAGIEHAGNALGKFFPCSLDDKNEVSDDISIG